MGVNCRPFQLDDCNKGAYRSICDRVALRNDAALHENGGQNNRLPFAHWSMRAS